MKSYPVISIITPSFNQGKYLEETIDSVLSQGYPNLEYIIIDGGSSDNSVEIIKKYQKYLAYWVSERDKGQSDAINKGVLRSTGDIINWLNSDDYYYPQSLFHVANRFIDPSVNVYAGRSRIFSPKYESFSRGTDIYIDQLEKTLAWARIDQPETFFRRCVWNQLGPLDTRYHFVMDKEFWFHYLMTFGLNGICQDNQLIVNFRHHETSKTMTCEKHFAKETTILYASMAYRLGFQYEVSLYREWMDVEPLPVLRTVMPLQGINWVKVYAYQFFLEMKTAYSRSDYEKALLFASYVSPELLSVEDAQEMNCLLLRMRWIPAWVKKLYNRISYICA